jgi:4-alpha-glucanotransferase
MPEALIDLALSSIGMLAVIPMQDLLGLGSEARLNTPGTVSDDNWRWKLPEDALTPERAKYWHRINEFHGRT